MMYGASWMDRWAASSWMSERGLSGRQISGGGSSPNSSRMTSARDVMSQHSMGVSVLRSRADDGPRRRICYADGARLRSLGVGGRGSPVGRGAGVVDCIYTDVGCRLEPLSDSIPREVAPPVIGRIELLVQSKVSEVRFHARDVRRFLHAHELGDRDCGDDPDHDYNHYQLDKSE